MSDFLRKYNNNAKIILPNWLTRDAISVYFVALLVVSFMYSSFSMPWYFLLSGIIAVLFFYLYGNTVIKQTSVMIMPRTKVFEKRIFWIAFLSRLFLMLFLYLIYKENYGDEFGMEGGDATFYDELGRGFADSLGDGSFLSRWNGLQKYLDVSDLGYAAYLGLIYRLTSNSVIVVRLLKCVWSTLTVILMYRLARRNFDEQIARITAIFIAIWPNFMYYCTGHLKEVEMVFLTVLFVEQADQMLRSRQFTAWKMLPILLIAASLFTLRTPLGLVALLALVFSVVMSSSKVVTWGKRIVVGVLAILLIGVVAGNRIREQSMQLVGQVQGGIQKGNMEWRSNRIDEGGYRQNYAKYAGTAVFAPLIFTLPFPTMTDVNGSQEIQQFNNGGNFIKNIISGFTILALVVLLMTGEWREHLLPLSVMLGYLVVLSMSNFAHSERFHQPAMPFEFMFAAYGLSIAITKPKYKRWFTYWCGLMFIACVAWNWFKLAGRGLT